jgi:ATP-dependent Zn protease
MIGNFGMGNKLEVFYNQEIDDNSDPFSRSLSGSDKYSEFTKTIFDKESLELVKEAYATAKTILNNNYDKLLSFSELLKTNTTIMANDINMF